MKDIGLKIVVKLIIIAIISGLIALICRLFHLNVDSMGYNAICIGVLIVLYFARIAFEEITKKDLAAWCYTLIILLVIRFIIVFSVIIF